MGVCAGHSLFSSPSVVVLTVCKHDALHRSGEQAPTGPPSVGPLLSWETGQRMPINDSWIAATAMSLKVPVVTRDDDFPDVEGLSITRV